MTDPPDGFALQVIAGSRIGDASAKTDLLSQITRSQTALKHGAGSCPVGRVPAGEIEAAVIDQLRALFRQPEIVTGTWTAARARADDISQPDARNALPQLDPLWKDLVAAERACHPAHDARVSVAVQGKDGGDPTPKRSSVTLRFPIHPRRCPACSRCRSAAHPYRMSHGTHKTSRLQWPGAYPSVVAALTLGAGRR